VRVVSALASKILALNARRILPHAITS